jgi:uncharacterized protein (TIGR02246 family)
MSAPTPAPTAVDDVLGRLSAAWNAGDATAYAAEFTPDATYVVFDGTVLRGPGEIEASHRWLFDGPLRGSTMGFATGDGGPQVRVVAPGVAHVLAADGGVRPAGVEIVTADRKSVVSLVLVEDGGAWRVAAFQNTRDTTGDRR